MVTTTGAQPEVEAPRPERDRLLAGQLEAICPEERRAALHRPIAAAAYIVLALSITLIGLTVVLRQDHFSDQKHERVVGIVSHPTEEPGHRMRAPTAEAPRPKEERVARTVMDPREAPRNRMRTTEAPVPEVDTFAPTLAPTLAPPPAATPAPAPVPVVATRQGGRCTALLGVRLTGGLSAPPGLADSLSGEASFEACAARCRRSAGCRQAVFSSYGPSCRLFKEDPVAAFGAHPELLNSSVCGSTGEEEKLVALLDRLKKQDRFRRVREGSCADAGAWPVANETACNGAAREFGWGDDAAAHKVMLHTRPEGCHVGIAGFHGRAADKLYFNANLKSAGNGAMPSVGLAQICKARPMPGECSGTGENCMFSRCCKTAGHQCYERDSGFSTCLTRCSRPGWTCDRIGDRTPMRGPRKCAKGGADCTLQQCCETPGMQCFEHNQNWASCLLRCTSHDSTCKMLGARTPMKNKCTWPGDECRLTGLCCKTGQSCYTKNMNEAYCTEKADPSWQGKVLGHSRWEYAVKPVPPAKAMGTSLFCLMAFLPGSNEWNLLEAARSRKASIFACEEHAFFKSWRSPAASVGTWKSVVNIDVFISVWNQVKADGRFSHHDWTVKVDPDSVFFPDRLRWHVKKLNAPRNFPIYLKNTYMGFGFFGAIEVFSKVALLKYYNNTKECKKAIGSYGGEDGFMKSCMDAIGAGYMTDLEILKVPHAKSCADGGRVCFHEFKDVGAWVNCYNVATR